MGVDEEYFLNHLEENDLDSIFTAGQPIYCKRFKINYDAWREKYLINSQNNSQQEGLNESNLSENQNSSSLHEAEPGSLSRLDSLISKW